MKTKLHSACFVLLSAFLLLTALPARAQDTVTISAAEFQRMTYSAHLHTQMAEKPELDASLQVLLELQRRNPNANPAALADLSRQALERYRTNAPAYIRSSGFRDEILAAYLDALRQVPVRTNFVPANLSLLQNLITRSQAPSGEPQADLVHSGSQRMLAGENDARARQILLDDCTRRAQGNAAFAAAMNGILLQETPISVSDTPAAIIGNTNSALHDNLTMQTLLALSATNGNGSLTVSSNQLMSFFSAETQTLWDTINTNLALQAEINQSQPDLLAYLTNQAAMGANMARVAAVQQGQARQIAAATAAIQFHSSVSDLTDPSGKTGTEWRKYNSAIGKIANGVSVGVTVGAVTGGWGALLAIPGILEGGSEILGLAGGDESPEEQIVGEIAKTQTLIRELGTNMNYRFDRVDQSLTTIFETLNEQMEKIVIIEGRVDRIDGNVDQIRLSLLDVQTELYRIERNLATFHALDWRYDLLEQMDLGLGYEDRVGNPMQYQDFLPSYVSLENTFYFHAYNRAASETLSRYTTLPFGAEHFYSQLSPGGATNVYAETLNYIKRCLREPSPGLGLGNLFPAVPILANPQDWNAGAGAWLELALENPGHYRRYQGALGRLDNIITKGRDLTNFLRSLTFTTGTTNINRSLYNAMGNYYFQQLTNFAGEVSDTEQQYASVNGFALDTARQWTANAPRLTATATEVLAAPPPPPTIPRESVIRMAAGGLHNLALTADGKLVGWGNNVYGQITVPTETTNVVAIAAGDWHSLALRGNGTVVAWGWNEFGQTTIPVEATNVTVIAAGGAHNLALRTDGTVVGWGWNESGQSTIPAEATNVMAIAAGAYHSLALRTNGTVVAWGQNDEGQTTIPTEATNVIAVAAGAFHNLALRGDGTVIAWGDNSRGQTTIPPGITDVAAIAAGAYHNLALRTDGTVIAWGHNADGQTNIPFEVFNVAAITAGAYHNLALRTDGTIVGWGANDYRECVIPPALTGRGAIAAGGFHNLALRADGTVVGWGHNYYGQTTIPSEATNLVAIAAGDLHSLALRADGTVFACGFNDFDQTTVPASATNVVAIAAGSAHSLALRADGKVVGWGANDRGQRTIPASATNIVAIAAGDLHSLALRADGKVVGWGYNNYGQSTIPASATNGVVAIAAGREHSLALKADGSVVGWGRNYEGQVNIPPEATNVVAIAAGENSLALRADGTIIGWGSYGGSTTIPPEATHVVAIATGKYHTLALRADGTIIGWGSNHSGQTTIPPETTKVVAIAAGYNHSMALYADNKVVGWGLNNSGQTTIPASATNVVAIAAGGGHSLALRADGSVVGWGLNNVGQITIPASATNEVVAIAAGRNHSLTLKADGTVIGWGWNNHNQTAIPAGLADVVAIAAGGYHSLALRANGTVVGWGAGAPGTSGWEQYGQTTIPPEAANVVALAAGMYHSLALLADGTVVAWGNNSDGQITVPDGATNVVAIAAGGYHSLALRADGTVVAWGANSYQAYGQAALPAELTDVVGIAAGGWHSLFLRVSESAALPARDNLSLVRAQIPAGWSGLFQGCNDYTANELGMAGELRNAATGLSGAKALLTAVLELGMPYALERDDILRGFLYGSESLMDLNAAPLFLEADNARLQATPDAPPVLLGDVAVLRYLRFSERLSACLDYLQASGQPEIPRLVGHTLRLLNLLRDAWATVPPPALEMWSENQSPRLVLYGEPYAHYGLQTSTSLSAPAWSTVTLPGLQFQTNLHNQEVVSPPVSGSPQRFYRALLPSP